MDTSKKPETANVVRGDGSDGAPAKRKREIDPRVRKIAILIGAVVGVIVLLFAIRAIIYMLGHQTTDDARVDADTVTITPKIAERVDRILVDTNQYVKKGQLLVELDSRDETVRLAQAKANLLSARMQARAADSNLALTIDQQNAQNEQNRGSIGQAESNISSAERQADAAAEQVGVEQNNVATAQSRLRSSEAAVPAAAADWRRAAADLERTSALVRTGDEPQSQLDSARASEAAARSNLQKSRDDMNSARADLAAAAQKHAAQQASAQSATALIGVQRSSLQTARGKLAESDSQHRIEAQRASTDASRAQVGTQQALVNSASNDLAYTKIQSPIDGYVGEKVVETGQSVATGMTLMTLVPSTGVYITANYKETQIGKMHPGQQVDINVDAYSGREFEGHVEAISPAAQNTFSLVPPQNASGNFIKVAQRVPVRIIVDKGVDDAHPLRVGMSVETSVVIK